MKRTTSPARRRGRGRRPLADVRADVLDAAAEVLFREGVGGFTMEKVVTTSGVSSATVFKYWKSRGALALDGYVHAVGDAISARDTGDIGADLTSMIVTFVGFVTRAPEGPVLAQLIGAAQTDPDLAAQFEDHYFGPRRREALVLLDAAKSRGQIRSDADPGLVIDLIWGACYIRMLLPHLTDQLTPEYARSVVDIALKNFLVGVDGS